MVMENVTFPVYLLLSFNPVAGGTLGSTRPFSLMNILYDLSVVD